MRSFRGCRGCKSAKRRCTEEKPMCSACAKAGRECQVIAFLSFCWQFTDVWYQYDTDALFRFSFVEPDGKAEAAKEEENRVHPAVNEKSVSKTHSS